jgi:gliding motility-associated-like protein
MRSSFIKLVLLLLFIYQEKNSLLKLAFVYKKQLAAKIRFLNGQIDRFLIFMGRYILLFCFLMLTTSALAQLAQDWCNPQDRPMRVLEGGFRIVGESAGCAPFAVTVEKTISENPEYIYNYRGGNPLTGNYMRESRTTATYSTQGSYRILQLASTGSGSAACQTVEVFATPNFSLRACSGRRVQVTIANDSIAQRYDAFLIDWGLPGSTPTRVNKSTNMTASFTYPDISVRNVTVTGIYMGKNIVCTAGSPRKPIVPSNSSLSAVRIRRVTTRPDGLVDILLQGAQGIEAELQMSTGGLGAFANTGQMLNRNDTTTVTVRNIDALKNTYCFRLSANDGCDNTGGSSSNVVCSTNLTATPQNRQNLLEWQEYPNSPEFVTYSFKRNSISTGGVANRSIVTTVDANVVCGEQYCYQMTVALSSGAESVSPLRCIKAISDEVPSAITGAFVQVSDGSDQIEVRGNPPTTGATPIDYKVIVLRNTDNQGDFEEVATLQKSIVFVDEKVNPLQHSYCYQLIYENSCGNRSEPTPSICSIHLYSNSSTTIDWTAASPFMVDVSRYEIYPVDEQGNLIGFPFQAGGNTTFSPDFDDPNQQLFRYRIAAYGPGVGPSFSNFFTFTRNAQIYVPDAFSPNDDGINDTFVPQGLFVDTFQMTIFNRWGESLFQTANGNEGWNGTIQGQAAPQGIYVYKITFTDSLGQQFVKAGSVTLLR